MANPRQQKIVAAAILAVAALGVATWLMSRDPAGLAPATPPRSTNRAATTGAASASDAGGTREFAPADATGTRHARVEEPTAPAIANLEIHVHFANGAGADEERVVALRAVAERSNRVVGESQCRGYGDEVVGYLDVPSNQWNHIEAVFEGAHVPGQRVHLGAGEHCRIDFACAAHVTRLRVIGPSAKLLPHMRIEILDHGAEKGTPFELPLAADGTVACHLLGGASANLVLSGSRRRDRVVPLRTHAGQYEFDTSSDATELLPIQPLLGFFVLRQLRPIAATVTLDSLPSGEVPVICTITTMAAGGAAESIHVLTETQERRRGPVEIARRTGDTWEIDLESLEPLGELRVEFDVDEQAGRPAMLVAVPLAGGEAVPLENTRKAEVKQAVLAVGDYRLAWAPHGTPDQTAAELVRIAAGKVTRLELAPRLHEAWSVTLRNAPDDLLLGLGWGSEHLGTSTNGTFDAWLGRTPEIGERAWIRALREKAAFDATFVSVDPATRRAEVTSKLEHALCTRLVPVPLRSNGPTRIHMLPTREHHEIEGMLHQTAQLLMLPGERRHGYVIEIVDGREQLTRWFEATAGTDEIALTPEGYWVTIEFPRPTPRAHIHCEGPDGGTACLRINAMEQSVPIYLAKGTTAIHVDVDDLRQSFDPRLSEFVVR